MSAPQSPKSPLPVIATLVAVGASVAVAYLLKDPTKLAGCTFVAAIAGAGLVYAFPPRRKPEVARVLSHAELAPLLKGVTDSRNEVINAMAILQQEIRLLQDAKGTDKETRALREELARLSSEVTSLKHAVTAKPAVSRPPFEAAPAKTTPKPAQDDDDGDFDVSPLSFDDDEEEKPVSKTASSKSRGLDDADEKPVANFTAPTAAKPSPIFVPEAEPVLETGLEPEDMDDDGDWLTGGLEEEDLVVTKKVDFEAIVKQDALRPKPKIDEEEQRVLREEMAQMADENDWVGAGLEDRDVKVKKTTANDALFDKLRAEIEAKRASKEATVGVRAPARGETALLVNITVAHGTKLFVRGVGPGLDVDKGSAMQQAGHGKWQWICPEQGKPCVVTVWENDDLQSEGNPIRIPGGFALTVTPTFRRKLKL
jgi:hypothetical protein